MNFSYYNIIIKIINETILLLELEYCYKSNSSIIKIVTSILIRLERNKS